jgi:hypothetical protein
MKLRQISLFLENRKGRLYDVCTVLGENGINIRALNIADTDEFGILRMVVDKPEEALNVLKEHTFVASVTDVVAVEVDDKPGGLAHILKTVTDTGLNIEYMYGFVEKKTDKALMVFRFDNPEQAIEVLTAQGISVVNQGEIESL